MKRMRLFSLLLLLVIGLVGCSSSSPSETQTFTLADLANFDGQSGRQAYVAVDGIVYDVTNASNWNNGMHNGVRLAGTDATQAIMSSPHGKSVLSGLPVVGKLVSDSRTS